MNEIQDWLLAHASMPEPNTGCWLAVGRQEHGRPRAWLAGKNVDLRPLAWRAFRGEPDPRAWPTWMCRTEGCVNPWHAKPIGQVERFWRDVQRAEVDTGWYAIRPPDRMVTRVVVFCHGQVAITEIAENALRSLAEPIQHRIAFSMRSAFRWEQLRRDTTELQRPQFAQEQMIQRIADQQRMAEQSFWFQNQRYLAPPTLGGQVAEGFHEPAAHLGPLGGGQLPGWPVPPGSTIPSMLTAKQQEAEDKAYALLEEAIGKRAAARIKHGGAYTIPSKLWPDVYYAIAKEGRVLILEKARMRDTPVAESCLQTQVTAELPWPDRVLAKIKAIQADETIVYVTGNVIPSGGGGLLGNVAGMLAPGAPVAAAPPMAQAGRSFSAEGFSTAVLGILA